MVAMSQLRRCLGASAAALLYGAPVSGQQAGTLQQEVAPAMPIERCEPGSCVREETSATMDMNWRWLRNKDGYNNCMTDQGWDPELCKDPESCSKNCMLEGSDLNGYRNTYNAEAVGANGLKLMFPKGPRVYLTEGSEYKMFKLLNREFTFDVDLSSLPCGMNAALYFIEMPADPRDGDLDTAGAKYGTGYCDAQCPHLRFVKGKGNTVLGDKYWAKNPDGQWIESGPDGLYGACCAEMDVLEANREANVFTAHPCKNPGVSACSTEEECGNRTKGLTGFCDKDGCGFSNYRLGDTKFWGAGSEYAVDTTKPMTIVTQFITADGTDTGVLKEIRRLYVQDGKVIQNGAAKNLPSGGDSITDEFCGESRDAFKEANYGYGDLGGLKTMGEAMGRGMVVSMSIWDDDWARMLWLDGVKNSIEQNEDDVGVKRGPCAFEYGTHEDMLSYNQQHGPVEVTFSNIKYGAIGSTYAGASAAAQASPILYP